MKSKEAIRDLRNSFELKNKKWAKNCLDTIEEEFKKKENTINEMSKAIIEYTSKLNIFWCNVCNEIAECPYNHNVRECVIKHFKKGE